MDISQITYGELKSFREKMNNINDSELIELYINHKENEERNKIIQKILDMFPKFPDQRLELNFIDKDKTMAVIEVYRDDIVISYLGYNCNYGLIEKNFSTYDEALLSCVCKKYLKEYYTLNSQLLIFRMLMLGNYPDFNKDGNKDNENNIEE